MTSSQLPYLGKATACCVPNCGLAFFGQDQVIASSGRYCCVVSAVTGLVNWLGLMDNSLSSTYLDLWDKCEAFFTPSNQTTYGGASRYNAALALNQYFEFSVYRLYRVISLEIVYIVVFCIAKIEYRCKKFMVFHKVLHQICTKIIANFIACAS